MQNENVKCYFNVNNLCDLLKSSNYHIIRKNGNEYAFIDVKYDRNGFSLLTPSSKLGKVRKVYNFFSSYFLYDYKESGEGFINFIEKKVNKKIKSTSLRTSNDELSKKVILKITFLDGSIIYAKVPLNKSGQLRVINESKLLPYVLKDSFVGLFFYNGLDILLLNQIKGKVAKFNFNLAIKKHPSSLLKESFISLAKHPRIKDIIKVCSSVKIDSVASGCNFIHAFIKENESNYISVSLEHGDYCYWNIIDNSNVQTVFDYEYGVLQGLKELDFLHYLYQHGFLVLKLNHKELYDYFISNIHSNEDKLPAIFVKNIDEFICLYCLSVISNRLNDGANYNDFLISNRRNFLEFLFNEGSTDRIRLRAKQWL